MQEVRLIGWKEARSLDDFQAFSNGIMMATLQILYKHRPFLPVLMDSTAEAVSVADPCSDELIDQKAVFNKFYLVHS